MKTYTIKENQCTAGLPDCFCPAPNSNIKAKLATPQISTERPLPAKKPVQDTFTYGLPQISPSDSVNDDSGFIALAFNPVEYHPDDDAMILVDYREPYLLALSPSQNCPILLSKDSAFVLSADGQLQTIAFTKAEENPTHEIQ